MAGRAGGWATPRGRRPRRADPRDGPGPQGGARALGGRAGGRGASVVVATHDVEFASVFAERVVLLGRRRADRGRAGRGGPLGRLVLRDRGGPHPRRHRRDLARRRARPHAARGDARCCGEPPSEPGSVASCYRRSLAPGAGRRVRLVRALPAAGADGGAGRGAGGARGRGPAGSGADPQRRGDHRHRADHRLRGRAGAPGSRSGRWPAVVSNLWLGQGPWTPWQMAGWGLVGLGRRGARRADRAPPGPCRARRRMRSGGPRLRRAPRPLRDGRATGGSSRWTATWRSPARGIPFNVAHAVGNIALALAAGPALVRMVSRYRSRFEFTWRDARRSRAAATPGEARAAAGGARLAARGRSPWRDRWPCRARPGPAVSPRPAQWLERAQNPDGGFGVVPERRLEPGDDRLGRARAGGRRAQPARPSPGRSLPDRLPALAGRRRAFHRRPGANDPGPARARAWIRAGSAAATWSRSFASDARGAARSRAR